tara:strand:+ start:585 stop:878 length:294 start_codon:yes stop_codon:yes gene_type:complete
MHVRFADTAEADLNHIKKHIEPESPQGLQRILTAIFTVAEQLESFPLLGRVGDVAGTFELSIPRTPYRFVYTVDDPYYVEIIHVLHGARKWPPQDFD